MFYKVIYDDSAGDMNAVLNVNVIAGTYVKVIVMNKTNPYWFDMFIDKLEKGGAHDIQVVDDHHNLNLEDDEDIVDEAEDTVTIMKKYIDKFNLSVDKTELSKVVQSLYDEALTLE
jgi:nanoRNase/pAp phosphatase (c-di-AMP/oligoRNAs hydrolase)